MSTIMSAAGQVPKRKLDEGSLVTNKGAPKPSASSKMVQLAPGDELNLQRTTKKPGEGAVTKRTLQNRKAQREFRKRREARVRELEERCRRYDQMGIEANSELQRFARNLKEENEALRNFIVRIGCGNVIPSLLEGISNQGPAPLQQQSGFGATPQQMMQQQQRPMQQQQFGQASSQQQSDNVYGGVFGDAGAVTGGTFGGGNEQSFYDGSSNASSDARSKDGGSIQQRTQDAKKNKNGSKNEESDTPLLSLNLAQDGSGPQQQQQQQRQPEFAPNSVNTSQKLDQTRDRFMSPSGTGLTAFLAGQAQQQQQNSRNGNEGGAGSGTGGTAMLFSNFNNNNQSGNNNNNNNGQSNTFGMPGGLAPMPIPQRSQQNAALLNPNPFPFAFNLSSNELNAQAPSTWWDQMGGGNDNVELDEKAQALANAQANSNGGTQSPFDLSTFLNGGVTPGGNFQLNNNPMDAISPAVQGDGNNANSNATLASDTEHMRMFINLIERKVAEREARTVASLGFQPPSQDPAHRKRSDTGKLQETRVGSPRSPAIRMSRSLTPSGVYSRLAQHPAFLSTNARELEELVDALNAEDSRNAAAAAQQDAGNAKSGRARASSSLNMHRGEGISPTATSSRLSAQSPSSRSEDASSSNGGKHGSSSLSSSMTGREATGAAANDAQRSNSGNAAGNVHVDEGAIGKLLGLLDQKRGSNDSTASGASGSNVKSDSTSGSGDGNRPQSYTMTMA